MSSTGLGPGVMEHWGDENTSQKNSIKKYKWDTILGSVLKKYVIHIYFFPEYTISSFRRGNSIARNLVSCKPHIYTICHDFHYTVYMYREDKSTRKHFTSAPRFWTHPASRPLLKIQQWSSNKVRNSNSTTSNNILFLKDFSLSLTSLAYIVFVVC